MIDREAIAAEVGGEPAPRQRDQHIQVRVPRRTLRQFRQFMPMRGSVSWFVREALKAFVLDMQQTPQEFVAETVEHMREDIVQGRKVRRMFDGMEERG